MCKCGREHCKGYVLLHPKEMDKISELKEYHLKETPNARFIIDPSPTSGEFDIIFYEMHIINDPNTPEKDIGSVVFTKASDEEIAKRVKLAELYEKAMLKFIRKKKGETPNVI